MAKTNWIVLKYGYTRLFPPYHGELRYKLCVYIKSIFLNLTQKPDVNMHLLLFIDL